MSVLSGTSAGGSARIRNRTAWLAGLAILLWVGGIWLIMQSVYARKGAEVYRQAREDAGMHLDTISTGIDRSLAIRSALPKLIANKVSIRNALQRMGPDVAASTQPFELRKQAWTNDPALAAIDGDLDEVRSDMRLGVLWVVNAAGDCIAASNTANSERFIGTNYADREYFHEARSGRPGQQYAMGRVTNIPGLYFSAPVMENGRFTGAVVAKIDMTYLSVWINQADVFLTDKHDVVTLARDKALEMHALAGSPVNRLDPDQRLRIYKRKDFPELAVAAWADRRYPGLDRLQNSPYPVLMMSRALPDRDLSVHVVWPLSQLVELDRQRNNLFVLVALLGGLSILGVAFALAYVRNMRTARRELAASDRTYRGLFDGVGESIYVQDATGRFLDVNRGALEMYGYRREEMVGMSPDILAAPGMNDLESVAAHFRLAWSGQTQQFEFWGRRSNGEIFPKTVTQTKGQYFGQEVIIATALDISGQKRLESELRDRETLFRSIFSQAGDGIELIDPETLTFIEINEAACRMLGYSREEYLHLHLTDTQADLSAADLRRSVDGVLARKQASFENRHRRKDGVVIDVDIKVNVVELNGRELLIAAWRDMSERLTTERKLAESERLLSAIVENEPECVKLLDGDGKLVYMNRAGLEMIEAEKLEQLLGKCVASIIVPACREAFQDLNRRVLKGETGTLQFEIRGLRGGRRWLETHAVPLRDAEGRVTNLLGLTRDITLSKQTEAELEQYRNHLEELVSSRTADLVAARHEAERLARVKSEFLANMSHEIRTPLNGVLGMAQIGLRNSEGRGKSQDTFAKIIDSGKLLLGIINDILDFSKIDAGRLKVESVPYDLNRLITETVEFLSGQASAKGLVLQMTMDIDPSMLFQGDPLRIQQVLLNLLSNAVKFTDSGVVTLSVALDADQLVILVSDTGIGMSEEQIKRAFNPFEQADGTTTRRFGGTGLGLTISKHLVALMGGEIRVESNPGAGSSFEVRLPCLSMQACALEPADEDAAKAGKGRSLKDLSILSAEDNEINRLVLEDMLADAGCRLEQVEDGNQAVERVRAAGAGAYSLVLMDIQMPVMDGYEATRQIHAVDPGLPVIGLTAHALEEERERCASVGMVGHVTKPFDRETLSAAIERHARR